MMWTGCLDSLEFAGRDARRESWRSPGHMPRASIRAPCTAQSGKSLNVRRPASLAARAARPCQKGTGWALSMEGFMACSSHPTRARSAHATPLSCVTSDTPAGKGNTWEGQQRSHPRDASLRPLATMPMACAAQAQERMLSAVGHRPRRLLGCTHSTRATDASMETCPVGPPPAKPFRQ